MGDLLDYVREFQHRLDTAPSRRTAKRAIRRGVAQFVRESEQAGCVPEQVAEANEACRKLGLTGVQYRPDGVVEYGSQRARQRHLRSIGLIDRS